MKYRILTARSCLITMFALGPPTVAAGEPRGVPSPPPYRVERNITYVEREGGPLKADIYLPPGPGPFPGVILIHGGGWAGGNKSDMGWHARHLARGGYAVMAVQYRLAPQHQFPAQIVDCQEAVRWFRRRAADYQLDPARLASFGYSAGGHLACLLGTAGPDDCFDTPATPAHEQQARKSPARVQAVVAGGAPCDLRVVPPDAGFLAYWLGGTRRELPALYRRASPIIAVTPDDPPAFFFHGERDTVVPRWTAEHMRNRLVAVGVPTELYVAEDKGHLGTFWDPHAAQAALRFLDRVLKP